MDHVNYFEDISESIPDYRKLLLLLILIKNDVELLNECGFLKSDIIHLNKEI